MAPTQVDLASLFLIKTLFWVKKKKTQQESFQTVGCRQVEISWDECCYLRRHRVYYPLWSGNCSFLNWISTLAGAMWASLRGLSTVGLFREAQEEWLTAEHVLTIYHVREKHLQGRLRAAVQIKTWKLILVMERPPLACVSVRGDASLLNAVTEMAVKVIFTPADQYPSTVRKHWSAAWRH